jgi:hypothetical protein
LHHSPNPFALVIFEIGSCFMPQPTWDLDPPIYAFHIAGVTGGVPTTSSFYWLRWGGVLWMFCLGWPQTLIILISASQVSRIKGVNHHTWLPFFFFYNLKIIKTWTAPKFLFVMFLNLINSQSWRYFILKFLFF